METGAGRNNYRQFPLDRGKINAREGGVRVPFIITGPGIGAGQESDVMVNGLDFYPTILSWTGTKKPKGQNLDGADLSTLLSKDPTDHTLVKNKTGEATHYHDVALSPWGGPAIHFAGKRMEINS